MVIFRSKTIDLTTLLNEKDYSILAEELSKIEIGILFNNAGIAEYKVLKFLTNTHKEITSINAINAVVPTLLCHAVLPQMIERKSGLVLIMSSAWFEYKIYLLYRFYRRLYGIAIILMTKPQILVKSQFS